MLNIKNYKITPEQLCEIESHLQLAAHILNSEDVPDWENLQTACRQICDVRQNLKWIREKSETPRPISKYPVGYFLPTDADTPEAAF